jgi:hypothetical protein
MNGSIDLVPRLEQWLAEDDGTPLPERVLDAVMAESLATSQVRGRGGATRVGVIRLAMGAGGLAIVALLGFGAWRLVVAPVGTESPSPSASASSAASSSPDLSAGRRQFESKEYGYAVRLPSDLGPWGTASERVFPAGTCIADLCWANFGIAVEESSTSLEDLAARLAATYRIEPVPTTLGGRPAVLFASDSIAQSGVQSSIRSVAAVHAGRTYRITWKWAGGSPLAVPQSTIEPLWDAFLGSFAFTSPS